jgi:hypothetical protein
MSRFVEVLEGGCEGELSSSDYYAGAVEEFRATLKTKLDARGRRVDNAYTASMTRLDSYLASANDRRGDAFVPGAGNYNPRDLTQRIKRAMEERLQPLTADKCFPINTELDPGALTYEQTRLMTTGRAIEYRGGLGDDAPTVEVGQSSVQQPILGGIIKVVNDFRELAADRFAGVDRAAKKIAGARRSMQELRSRWIWRGSQANGMYGIIGHPYVDTATSQVPYTSASAVADIIADFVYWAQWADNQSGSAYKPDSVVIGQKLYNYLAGTVMALNNSSNVTILEMLKRLCPDIVNWMSAPELNATVASNVHGLFFYAKGTGELDRSVELMDAMPATLLAPEKRALGEQTFMVMFFGGANQRSAGDNLLVHVEGPA